MVEEADGAALDTEAPEGTSNEPEGVPEGASQEPEGQPEGQPEGDQADEEYAAFTMPEGVELDEELLGKATPIFKELGLTQENAQKVVDLAAEMRQADSQAMIDAHQEQVQSWETEAKNDKEFGGDKFDENVGIARTGIEKVGSPALKEFLDETGFGNHPELFKMMVRVGKMVSEDDPGGGDPAAEAKDRASTLYPNETQET